ncbi:4'-phosphopantetheinyl transferase [Mergibacter septicus]|uniref:4'-phosphopantetheinyl transferase family protein n=1 Tax=Mergibacter septicus TaxID=221402 RepID=UPI001C77E968|nr:4'-phosphopantetheinyl transferase superfamily protein [Mergibacter septicus]QDJ12500.1 4'-phosphopantetheinyl transferase [Mergibacter septicus]
MPTLIAWGNVHQNYPFEKMPQPILAWLETKISDSANNFINQSVQKKRLLRKIGYFLLWRLLHRHQLEHYFNYPFIKSEKGRPSFLIPENIIPKIDFNLSHSGDWVAVIVSINTNNLYSGILKIGIDIESPQKKRNFLRLLHYYATENEIRWWQKQVDQEKAFYQSWCCREAILKSSGIGIVGLSDVIFEAENNKFITQHCPIGNVIFFSKLPFYLACFSQENEISCFEWNGELTIKEHLEAKFFSLTI